MVFGLFSRDYSLCYGKFGTNLVKYCLKSPHFRGIIARAKLSIFNRVEVSPPNMVQGMVKLNHRHQEILRAAIRHYIATAEPVGSKSLVDEYNLNISAATIRSGFSALEKAGLLYQPHTSAGRVPSDSGYRLYVDRLIQPSFNANERVVRLFNDRLNRQGWSLEAILRGAAQILATMSGYITLISMPQIQQQSIVRHWQFVRVEAARVMSIVVLDNYETKSVLMPVPADIDEEIIDRQLTILANFLNDKLQGKSLLEISKLDWSELDRELHFYADEVAGLMADIDRQTQPERAEIMVQGISEILSQPEFSQLQQVKTLLHLLECERDSIWPLICQLPAIDPTAEVDRSPLTIIIGAENPLAPMQACTLISATYHQDSLPVGSVGLLGPTRMPYEDAISLVQATADYISDAISSNNKR
jgi:heat-inducible transcriptional repressor